MNPESIAVSFPGWKSALVATGWSESQQAEYRREILSFLHLCKVKRAPATVMLVKEYLAERAKQGPNAARVPLLWFFQEAKRQGAGAVASRDREPDSGSCDLLGSATGPAEGAGSGPKVVAAARPKILSASRSLIPRPAAADLGEADWERDLIKAARRQGLLWRSEETYRGWAKRFARFLVPRSPYLAEAVDVAAFLTDLAVKQRASPATQKQALNALVFLMQEGLQRQLGEIDFRRATPQRRMPTVLSKEECRRLFAELAGTERLMAELAYGAGLRLMELLRLRVHHLDLERGCLTVHGGKGGPRKWLRQRG